MSTIQPKKNPRTGATYWSVVYYDAETRKPRWESLSKFAGKPIRTKRAAEKAHQQWIRKNRRAPIEESSLPKFFENYRKHASKRKTQYTRETDDRRLRVFEEWAPQHGVRRIEDITRRRIHDFQDSLTCGATTKNHYASIVSAALSVAVDWELIDSNPLLGMKKIPNRSTNPRRSISDADIDIIESEFPNPERIVCALALWAGLRRGDIVNLKWAEVDFAKKTISVRSSVEDGYQPKATRYRGSQYDIVTLIPHLAEILSELKRSGDGNEVYVLDDGSGGPLYRPITWTHKVNPMLKAHGINATLHELRHTFITNLARSGVHIMALQKLARLVDIRTAERYTHLDRSDIDREAQKLLTPGPRRAI